MQEADFRLRRQTGPSPIQPQTLKSSPTVHQPRIQHGPTPRGALIGLLPLQALEPPPSRLPYWGPTGKKTKQGMLLELQVSQSPKRPQPTPLRALAISPFLPQAP